MRINSTNLTAVNDQRNLNGRRKENSSEEDSDELSEVLDIIRATDKPREFHAAAQHTDDNEAGNTGKAEKGKGLGTLLDIRV